MGILGDSTVKKLQPCFSMMCMTSSLTSWLSMRKSIVFADVFAKREAKRERTRVSLKKNVQPWPGDSVGR